MNSDSKTLCPVCGYNLGFPPWIGQEPSDEICPCCGIQFGYDDAAGGNAILRVNIYNDLRTKWIDDGMPWRSLGVGRPLEWNPKKQLSLLFFMENNDSLAAMEKRIDQYHLGKLSLPQLSQDLLITFNEMVRVPDEWRNKFLKYWGAVEEINALALDQGTTKPLPGHQNIVKKALKSIRLLVGGAV